MGTAVLWGGLAAASLLVGYFLARANLSSRTVGIVMGFGAGALLAAICYELIPASVFHGRGMALAFAAGAMLTMLADAMMPEAFEHGGKMVGLFTVLGFLVAAVLSVRG